MDLVSKFVQALQNLVHSTTGLVTSLTILFASLISLIGVTAKLRPRLMRKKAETHKQIPSKKVPSATQRKRASDNELPTKQPIPASTSLAESHDELAAPLDEMQQLANVKSKAIQIAYEELHQLNKAQKKVTEEELRDHTTAAAVAAQIARSSNIYGNPEEAIKTFMQIYSQIWREGGAVVTHTEQAAILQAQEDKRKDVEWGFTSFPEMKAMVNAKSYAIMYIAGKKATADGIPLNEVASAPFTEADRAQEKLYIDTYIKAYRLYEPPPKKNKLFGGS